MTSNLLPAARIPTRKSKFRKAKLRFSGEGSSRSRYIVTIC